MVSTPAGRTRLSRARPFGRRDDGIPLMNERQQAHIDHYLRRLAHWRERKPASTTARLLAARDVDEAHPLRSEEEAKEVVEYLWRLEGEQAAS